MDINGCKVKVDIDTNDANETLTIMQLIREELRIKLVLNIFSMGRFCHFFPRAESSVGSDKFRELFIIDFLQIFDATFVKHCLESLKVSVFPNEIVRH